MSKHPAHNPSLAHWVRYLWYDGHVVALALPGQLREHGQRATRVALVHYLPRKRHAHHLRAVGQGQIYQMHWHTDVG